MGMETAPRLKAEIWVKALIRRCEVAGAAAMVVRRGDSTSGVVLVKVNHLDRKATVFTPARDGEGAFVWMRGTGADPVDEIVADTYIDRHRAGRHFLDEPIAG